MCEQCVGEDAFPRRRFLRLAAAGAVGAAAVASLDSRVAQAKPSTQTSTAKTFAPIAAPSIVTRAQWGADESIRTWAPQWNDSQVRLPDGRWQHVLADTTIDGGAVDLEALFGAFPVALLERSS